MSYYMGMSEEEFARLPHDNRSTETIVAVVLCMSIATIAVLARLYTRHFILRKFWLDDYLAVAGMVSCAARARVARTWAWKRKKSLTLFASLG